MPLVGLTSPSFAFPSGHKSYLVTVREQLLHTHDVYACTHAHTHLQEEKRSTPAQHSDSDIAQVWCWTYAQSRLIA